MFNKIALAISLLAASAFASPTPTGTLEKRAVKCGTVSYTDAQVELCRSTLCKYDNKAGPGGYPHFYSNFEKLSFGTYVGSLYEFPLVSGTKAYSGGAPGADRCVAAYDAKTGNCRLVGAMTHRNAPKTNPNAFLRCA